MNFRIHNKGIASGLAASALVSAAPHQAGATELECFVDVNSIQAFDVPQFTTEALADETNSARASVVIELPAEPVWEATSQTRFEELVERIALEGGLSGADELEYKNLKALRKQEFANLPLKNEWLYPTMAVSRNASGAFQAPASPYRKA